MAESIILTPGATREQRYAELMPQIKAVLEPETDIVANLANLSAMLQEAFGFLWCGWYLRRGDELVLGPFQGPLACTRIRLDKGVCGAAATRQQTIIVPDVDQFPGHIACSSASRSEIVVPLVTNGITRLVLDIDSAEPDHFSAVDQQYLEEIIAFLGHHHSWTTLI